MPKKPYDPRAFPPFAVTVDLVILTMREGQLHVLLLDRAAAPFKGRPALPGGFVRPTKNLLTSAQEVLAAKTGVSIAPIHLEQLATYGEPKRDPRMRVVSVAWLALAANLPEPIADPETTNPRWVPIDEASQLRLAFDHGQILSDGVERARSRIEYTTLATHFCDDEFTMSELRGVYEAVWGQVLDPANFDRKIRTTVDFVVPTGDSRKQLKGRPARTYKRGPAKDLQPPIRRS